MGTPFLKLAPLLALLLAPGVAEASPLDPAGDVASEGLPNGPDPWATAHGKKSKKSSSSKSSSKKGTRSSTRKPPSKPSGPDPRTAPQAPAAGQAPAAQAPVKHSTPPSRTYTREASPTPHTREAAPTRTPTDVSPSRAPTEAARVPASSPTRAAPITGPTTPTSRLPQVGSPSLPREATSATGQGPRGTQVDTARTPERARSGNMIRPSSTNARPESRHGQHHRAQQAHRSHVQGQSAQDRTRHRSVVQHRRHVAARHAAAARHATAHRSWVARHHRHHPHRSAWRPWRPWRPYWARPHVVHHHHARWYRPYWAYGVFIYGTAPAYHTTTVVERTETAEPVRKVDRSDTFAVGLRSGSYMAGYEGGPGFGDFGLGVALRYRAAEALGFEVGWQYHDQQWASGTERISQPFSASVQLFALPWTNVNPYVLAGLTWTNRNYDDDIGPGRDQVEYDDVLFGPHGGLGIEFGVGDQISLGFEGRILGYLNQPEGDPTVPGAFQGTMGLNFYF